MAGSGSSAGWMQRAAMATLAAALLLAGMSPAGASAEEPAPGLGSQCIAAGLVRPTLLHPMTMRHAGIRPLTPGRYHSQGLAGWLGFAAMPEGCAPAVVRSAAAQIQMQQSSNRRGWVNVGNRNGNMEVPGNEERATRVLWAPNHAWPDYLFNECSGGKGWLRVRAIVTALVKDGATQQRLGARRYVFPARVRGNCKAARASQQATADYQEEWDGGSGSARSSSPAAVSTASLEQSCIKAGTALPAIARADVSHPGDRKKQLVYAKVNFAPMPAECAGVFERSGSVRFQLQDPSDHERWFNVGPFRDFVFEGDPEDGGQATAYYFENEEISNPRFIYRCTPGSGKTHARAVFRQQVSSAETGQTVGQETVMRPLTIKHVPFKLDAEQRRRGAVQGAC